MASEDQTYLIKRSLEAKLSDFFRPPILRGHSFAAAVAMMMHSSSFESPMNYPFELRLMKSVAALLSHIILAQINPI